MNQPETEIARLRAALEPFVSASKHLPEGMTGGTLILVDVKQCLDAGAALAIEPPAATETQVTHRAYTLAPDEWQRTTNAKEDPALPQVPIAPPLTAENCDSLPDAGIAREVDALRAAGVETFESCQGGSGHAFPDPTVRFHGGIGAGLFGLAAALKAELRVADLRRTWPVIDGEPTGPYWELTFASKSAAPSPTVLEAADALAEPTHELKCWPEYFQSVVDGIKTFEIRKQDHRRFFAGDTILLNEYDPHDGGYTGRKHAVEVVYVTHFPDGLRDDCVCMAIRPYRAAKAQAGKESA